MCWRKNGPLPSARCLGANAKLRSGFRVQGFEKRAAWVLAFGVALRCWKAVSTKECSQPSTLNPKKNLNPKTT